MSQHTLSNFWRIKRTRQNIIIFSAKERRWWFLRFVSFCETFYSRKKRLLIYLPTSIWPWNRIINCTQWILIFAIWLKDALRLHSPKSNTNQLEKWGDTVWHVLPLLAVYFLSQVCLSQSPNFCLQSTERASVVEINIIVNGYGKIFHGDSWCDCFMTCFHKGICVHLVKLKKIAVDAEDLGLQSI